MVMGFLDLSTWITLNDLELQKRFLVFFWHFLAAAHILRINCDKMPEDKPRQPAYEIFSIKRIF